jgi:hypothetical protein
MSLPTPITLSVGSPAADVVYDKSNGSSGQNTLYSAASPQGDLAGRLLLTVRHEETKSGLVRSNLKIRVPVYVAATTSYDGHIQADATIVRKSTAPVSVVQDVIEQLEKALVQLKDELAKVES